MSAHQLVEHFFRHEYGRLVAMLSRRVGVQHIAAVEDAAQSALVAALQQALELARVHEAEPAPSAASDAQGDLLRMLFVRCDALPGLSPDQGAAVAPGVRVRVSSARAASR